MPHISLQSCLCCSSIAACLQSCLCCSPQSSTFRLHLSHDLQLFVFQLTLYHFSTCNCLCPNCVCAVPCSRLCPGYICATIPQLPISSCVSVISHNYLCPNCASYSVTILSDPPLSIDLFEAISDILHPTGSSETIKRLSISNLSMTVPMESLSSPPFF